MNYILFWKTQSTGLNGVESGHVPLVSPNLNWVRVLLAWVPPWKFSRLFLSSWYKRWTLNRGFCASCTLVLPHIVVLRDFRDVFTFCVFALPVLCVAAHSGTSWLSCCTPFLRFRASLYAVLPHTVVPYFVTFVLYSLSAFAKHFIE